MRKNRIVGLLLALCMVLSLLPALAGAVDAGTKPTGAPKTLTNYGGFVGEWSSEAEAPWSINLEVSSCNGETIAIKLEQGSEWGRANLYIAGTFAINGNMVSGRFTGSEYSYTGNSFPGITDSGTITMSLNPDSIGIQIVLDNGTSRASEKLIARDYSGKHQPIQVAETDARILVNGQEISFDQWPIVADNRILVPMRNVFEAMGVAAIWDPETESILGMTKDKTVRIFESDSDSGDEPSGIYTMDVNDMVQMLDVAPLVIHGRTLVPLRAVAEVFDATVNWDSVTNTATIVGTIPESQRVSDTEKKQIEAFTVRDAEKVMEQLGFDYGATQGGFGYTDGKKCWYLPITLSSWDAAEWEWLMVYSDGTYERVDQNGNVLDGNTAAVNSRPPKETVNWEIYSADVATGDEFVARWSASPYLQANWPQSVVAVSADDSFAIAQGKLKNGMGEITYAAEMNATVRLSVSLAGLKTDDIRELFLALLNVVVIDLPLEAQGHCADVFMFATNYYATFEEITIAVEQFADGTILINGSGGADMDAFS